MSAGTQIDFSKYETSQAGTSTPAQIDFSKYEQPSGSQASQSTPQEATLQKATGISAQPQDNSLGGKLTTWASNVADDIKNGTDKTGVGTVLQKMGAHGVYNGNSQGVGDFMASLPLGLSRMAKGVGQVAPGSQGSTAQGLGNIVGGGLQAATMPLAVGSPVEAEAAASGLSKAGQVVSDAMPAAKMAAAGQKFNQLRGAIGDHTVEMTDQLGDALTNIKMAADSGTTLPTPVNKFVTRIADLEKGPLTYDEARNFYSNVSDLAASDKMAMNKNAQRLVLQFKGALGDTIANTADKAGKLQTYQDAMQGFASGAQLRDKLDYAKDLAVKYGGPAIIGEGAYQALKHIMNISDLGH